MQALSVRVLASVLCFVCSVSLAQAQSNRVLRDARTALAEGNQARAVEVLEAVDAEKRTPDGYFVLGLAYQGLLKHPQAVLALEQADNKNRRVLAARGRSLDALGRAEEAKSVYAKAWQMDSTNQSVGISLARLLADEDRWKDVSTIYERLLAEDIENPFLQAQLGTAYFAQDSVMRAINHFEQSRRLNPRNVKLLLQLSQIYIRMEYYTSASRVIDNALEEYPKHKALWHRRGEIAINEEEYTLAGNCFRSALTYGDSSAVNLQLLGVSHYMNAEYEDADQYLTWSDRKDSTNAMNLFYLGMTQRQMERFDEALVTFERSSRHMNKGLLADLYAQVANTYDVNESPSDAIKTYRLALGLVPAKREIYFHLGALYDEHYADKKVALDHYQTFLERVDEGELPQFESYAKERIRAINEELFFREGRMPEQPLADSAGVQQADTSRTGGQE